MEWLACEGRQLHLYFTQLLHARWRVPKGAVYPYIGDIQAILVMPDGTLEGASDRRRGGAAAGY